MQPTFGDQLKLYALSVAVIDRNHYKRVKGLIDKYCRDTLGIEFIKLYLAAEKEGQPGLKRFGMQALDLEDVKEIKTSGGHYNGQTSFAYDKRKPLWIVSASGKQKLKNCDRSRDQWSGLRAIPTYLTTGGVDDSGIMTSIIVPISDGDDVLGVVNFESSDYVDSTDEAKSELSKIAQTLGILIRLYRAADAQESSADLALENLQEVLSRPLYKLTKPKIFLASSADAEPDVIGVVLGVLKENAYVQRLDLVYWKDMDQPGSINRQLLEAIARCRYGICYFSQKDGKDKYVDNINVVFEAGMFHGRVHEITPVPASWVPIRERQSPDLPFDFAQERILWVERNKSGTLKTKSFVPALRRTLDALLSGETSGEKKP